MTDEFMVNSILKDLTRQKENLILESLNDLISRNLLEVQETQPILVRDFDKNKIVLQQSIKLVLKDKEYIENLEKENEELKLKLKNIKDSIKDV